MKWMYPLQYNLKSTVNIGNIENVHWLNNVVFIYVYGASTRIQIPRLNFTSKNSIKINDTELFKFQFINNVN